MCACYTMDCCEPCPPLNCYPAPAKCCVSPHLPPMTCHLTSPCSSHGGRCYPAGGGRCSEADCFTFPQARALTPPPKVIRVTCPQSRPRTPPATVLTITAPQARPSTPPPATVRFYTANPHSRLEHENHYDRSPLTIGALTGYGSSPHARPRTPPPEICCYTASPELRPRTPRCLEPCLPRSKCVLPCYRYEDGRIERYTPSRHGRLPRSVFRRNGLQDQRVGHRGAIQYLHAAANSGDIYINVNPIKPVHMKITKEVCAIRK